MGLISITWRDAGIRSTVLITDYRPKEGTVNYRVTYDGSGNPIKTEAKRSSAAVGGSWVSLNEADKKALKEWEMIISYGEK